LHNKVVKAKNKEIQKLKEDVANLVKQKDDVSTFQSDLKKEKVKSYDLAKQKSRLETQMNHYRENLTEKSKQNMEMSKEIQKLKECSSTRTSR
jgi:hypothetical protein